MDDQPSDEPPVARDALHDAIERRAGSAAIVAANRKRNDDSKAAIAVANRALSATNERNEQ